MAQIRARGRLRLVPAELSPSNRGESGSQESKALVGPPAKVDTLGLAYAARTPSDLTGWDVQVSAHGTPESTFKARRSLPGGGFLNVGVGDMAWVEASLPKRVHEDNIEALDLEETRAAAAGMLAAAFELAPPDESRDGDDLGRAKVVRLDLVRDFDGVEKVGPLLDGLAVGVRQPQRWKVSRWSDAERGHAETLSVGPRSHKQTLYDKHQETKGRAPRGRLRFESRLHREQLTSTFAKNNAGHIRWLADLSEGKMQQLTRAMFHRAGFDREVSAPERVVERVFASDNGLTKRQQRELWAYLTARSFNVDLGYARHITRKYERIAADLSLCVSVDLGSGFDMSVSLDFDNGCEVLRAA